jgi:large subunit ribosomal protein L30
MPHNSKDEVVVVEQTPKLMLVIRIRGAPNMCYKIEDTLKMLRLHKPCHGALVVADASTMGMLKKAKDFIAYGEVDEKTLVKLLRNRGLLTGNKQLTEDHVKNKTEYKDMESLSKALLEGKIKIKDIDKLKPVFRLHPPRGGFRGKIKKPYTVGGTLGNVGSYINELAGKMI